MAKIRRKKPPKHRVIIDTNILWSDNKKFVVDPDFMKFWDDQASTFDLELLLPAVVRGELLYQRTSSANRALRKAESEFEAIRSIAEKAYRHRLTSETLRGDIATRLDEWVRSVGARVEDIPVGAIDWLVLIDDAIWHRPPFSNDSKDQRLEKGFKDALILQTIIHVCQENKAKSKIAFVCNDKLLRDTADSKLSEDTSFSTFESVSDFEAYLRLTEESLTDEFVRSIQRKATSKFFKPNDHNSLLEREAIIPQIREKWAADFRIPESQPPYVGSMLFSSITSGSNWQKVGREGIWVSRSRFARLEGEDLFHWKANITFVQLFQRPVYVINRMVPPNTEENLLFLRFEITWCANVRSHGGFYNRAVTGISLAEHTFEPPTSEQIREYRIENTDTHNEASG